MTKAIQNKCPMRYLIILILAICVISCKRHADNHIETNSAANSSTTATSDTATLHILRLSSALYKNPDYQTQEVYYIDKDTRCIEIARNERLIKTIKLPNCQAVKDFSINVTFPHQSIGNTHLSEQCLSPA